MGVPEKSAKQVLAWACVASPALPAVLAGAPQTGAPQNAAPATGANHMVTETDCTAPSLVAMIAIGGPVYWIRNIVYHMPGGSTRLTGGSAGAIFYNDTVLSETQAQGASNVHWANNPFLGENSAPAIFTSNTYTNDTSSDSNGFRPNPGAPYSFAWNSPPWATAADYTPLMRRRGANPGPPDLGAIELGQTAPYYGPRD
jgi:hypothetical protein